MSLLPRSIRRNLFNVVILCDPSSKEARPLLKLLESFYVHRAPTRIGIIFKVNDDPAVSGKMDAGVALLDAYNYIAQVRKEKRDKLDLRKKELLGILELGISEAPEYERKKLLNI